MSLTVAQFAIAAGVILFGSYLNGSLGFGMGMIAAPILVLVNPVLVPAPILITGALVTVFGMIRDRAELDFRGAGWALAGRFPGSIAGAFAVTAFSVPMMGLSIGVSVLAGVLMGILGIVPRRSPGSLFGAGLLSGLMSTLAAIGAPPIVLMYQNAPPAYRRAALSMFFFAGTIISLGALVAVGAINREVLVISAALAPAVVIGYAIGVWGPRIREGRAVRVTALTICTVAGVIVTVRSVATLLGLAT